MPSKFVHQKVKAYIVEYWNMIDAVTIVLFVTGLVLKCIPDQNVHEASRIVQAINLVTFFLRLLHIFSVNPKLGPTLVMIARMVSVTLFRMLTYV
jgi:transient receptor potential cation channel subfamily M protein 2